jgi:LuxR family maltose regulon positive regulatory protein
MATKEVRGPPGPPPHDVQASAVPRPVAGLVDRPRLFALLDRGAMGRATALVAPAGSGKTMLLASWLRRARLPGPVAWVSVDRDERDAARFWHGVLEALRGSGSIATGDPLATLAPAPGAATDDFLEHLLDGLGRLTQTVLLVLDDLHQLRAEDGLRGIERLLERAPAQLRVVMAGRHDLKLGLHRLRLEGELVEILAADLHFTPDEAAELLAAAGVTVETGDVERLHQRTEGWAAGLRLAAMSLVRHEEPHRFVVEFSGSERTVADYLLAEVLASQPPEVRELLLRTCILERVTGPLADLLTGRIDCTRLLHGLEESNSLVIAVDVRRSWFRYHQLLGDLMRLELEREAPDEATRLHRLAAGWFAEQGHLLDAIRHAELGEDWELAVELLGRYWVHLVLDGEEATLGSLLDGLPAHLAETDAEVAAIAAAGHLTQSRWGDADALIATAGRSLTAVPAARRHRAEMALATVQLFRARRLGDVGGLVEGASVLLEDDGAADPELAALALMNLGIAETWTRRAAEAEEHLQRGLALARQVARPYVEMACLAGLGAVANLDHRLDDAERLLREAIAIADRVGWSELGIAGATYVSLGAVLIERGSFDEGEQVLTHAEEILAGAPEPAASVAVHHSIGMLAMSRGRFSNALAAFREGERLTGQLRAQHFLAVVERQWQLRALLGLGDAEPVRAALASAGHDAFWCNLKARLLLADGDAEGAAAAVAPVLAGEAAVYYVVYDVEALLLEAVARARLGDAAAAERSVERALALTEPVGRVLIYLTVPGVRELLEGHPRHRTAHTAHLAALLDHLAGVEPGGARELAEPLSDRELAVLRFLPTNLSASEIGGELFLSVHTVKTHMRRLYAKLEVHTRSDAVARGRALGLLAPSRRG